MASVFYSLFSYIKYEMKLDEVSIVRFPTQLVAGIRKEGSYQEIPVLLKKVYDYAASKRARFAGSLAFLWHESLEDYQEKNEKGKALLEVCAPIAEKIEESREIKCYELDGGRMAKIIHRGPYDGFLSTYKKLFDWSSFNQIPIKGPIREYYLNDPDDVEPEKLLTEIVAPLD